MKKIFFLFLVLGLLFPLNVTHKVDSSGITFIVDNQESPQNLTISILKDGTVIEGYTVKNENMPYIKYILTKEPGIYSIRVVDKRMHFAEDVVKIEGEKKEESHKEETQFQIGTLIIIAGVVLVVIISIISFINIKKHS